MFRGYLKKYSPLSISEELIHESFVSFISVSSLCVLAMRCQLLMCYHMAVVTQASQIANVKHQFFHLSNASRCLAWRNMVNFLCRCVDAMFQAILAQRIHLYLFLSQPLPSYRLNHPFVVSIFRHPQFLCVVSASVHSRILFHFWHRQISVLVFHYPHPSTTHPKAFPMSY